MGKTENMVYLKWPHHLTPAFSCGSNLCFLNNSSIGWPTSTASTDLTAHLHPRVAIAQVLKFRILLSKENVLIIRSSLSIRMRKLKKE